MLPNTYYKVLHSRFLWSLSLTKHWSWGKLEAHHWTPSESKKNQTNYSSKQGALHRLSTLQTLVFQDLPKNSFFSPILNLQLVPSAGKYVRLFITKARKGK